MKKIILSIAFVLVFGAWTIYLHNKQNDASVNVLASETLTPGTDPFSTGPALIPTAGVPTIPVQQKPGVKTLTPTSKTPTPVVEPPKPVPSTGKYIDGSYIGSIADAYYGNLQVQAIINNGELVDVQFLQYPNDRSTSRRISAVALPRLRQEAIDSQSASVRTISGATDVSGAFRQSLASALTKAART